MTLAIRQMHDATLVAIRFDWATRTCTLEFAGAPDLLEPFAVVFSDVTELVVPAHQAWGSSVSVLEVVEQGPGRYDFAMQSGDTITVVASNNSCMDSPCKQRTD
jgi:hypothetical protein